MKLKHFSTHEFECKGQNCCGNSSPMNPEYLRFLDRFREKLGEPWIITSGFRCRTHNQRIGGASNSLHTWGVASDGFPKSKDLKKALRVLSEMPEFERLSIGVYPSFLHIDMRVLYGMQVRRWGIPF